ncbi:hypothetical protein INT47_001971 [Mucor saturninus]|uniref:Uncharacterized protein n=1 Tax=Mucor saturninus TaxID=64648 RepID=A0A8H7RF34_9FUNG|nr:hypothetical protein INT47_001971 [Mucor saturninus]
MKANQQEIASETINKPSKRKKGVKTKDTPEEKKSKSDAKRARNVVPNTSNLVCKSCGQNGHAFARSREYLNYNYTVKKLIEKNLGSQNQRYTVSIPLKSFMSSVDENANNTAVEKSKVFLCFCEKSPTTLSFFVCRAVHQNLSVQNFQSQYPLIPHLAKVWDEINGVEGVNLTVDKGNLTLYGQVVSSACESIATCYNNYYIENFENIIANIFIYMIRKAFHDIKMPVLAIARETDFAQNHQYVVSN